MARRKDDPLSSYRQKRDFTVTPEPQEGGAPSHGALRFVVQKHWATRLHYDFRLELDGTMKSWAVPKGPSYDPADKRMAVPVEDHPISYNTFEGDIPQGQYGGGHVIVWDKGWWEPLEDPEQGLRSGKLKFVLHGHKLHGRWTLVRMGGGRGKPAWLLIKERDGLERAATDYSVVDALPDSVGPLPEAPGRPATAPSKPAQSPAAKPSALPDFIAPQLATLVDEPPAPRADWLYELKFDGYRILARIDGQDIRLLTRAGKDWTQRMPHLVQALARLGLGSAWLDGEIVVPDSQGVPDFQALQNAFDATGAADVVYYAFDLPFLDGRDLRNLPLVQRRAALQQALAQADERHVRLSAPFDAPAAELLASSCALGFEGVIGKRRDAPYVSARSQDWIKLKCSQRQEFVIAGYTDPKGTRTGLGSLLLGVHDEKSGALRYAGNVGTGFTRQSLQALSARLRALKTDESPFAQRSHIAGSPHWVRPELMAEVAFAGWTRDARVRHAVFHGLREDKPAAAIVRERSAPLVPPRQRAAPAASGKPAPAGDDEAQVGTLRITHPDRVIDPTTGATKLDLVRYYARVGPLMMEHLAQRPVSVVRTPGGVQGVRVFQRHFDTGDLPGLRALDPALYEGHPPLFEVASAEGLAQAAQMSVVELHTWNARRDRIDRPDRMVFDLDPGEDVAWQQVLEGAELVRVLLQELGLPAFLKTSGGKGLHVVTPIKRLYDWDTVRAFSQAVVQHLARTLPQRFVAQAGPRNRVGRIFVDWLRNSFGATTVSAWSVRARPGLGISVPLRWNELHGLESSAHWHLGNIDARLDEGNAPWRGYAKATVSLTPAMRTLKDGR
ncbi:DNA ligase D [Pulveribacter suum]|uniref:DNA ligase (ATP) n=1 Tax=Pulveribacter suum TaxID=2116657 RepID=A0A2P1NLK2_9BURK|nr:DNA ligase D [Pulveribacter suum]AVP57866.1 DNA ligase D [Pulveribacter suum]